MKKLLTLLLIFITLASLTSCTTTQRKDTAMVAGGVIGGVAGGVLTGGAVLGVTAGAIAGGYTGRSITH